MFLLLLLLLLLLLDCGSVPSSSATFMRKALRSSSTRLRPRSMKSSKRCVNWVIRSRRSLKPKSTEGRVSAMEGASVVYCAWEPEKDAPKRLGVAGIAAIVGGVVDGMDVWCWMRCGGEVAFDCVMRRWYCGCRKLCCRRVCVKMKSKFPIKTIKDRVQCPT
jgi:hypothetical protein